MPPLNTRLHVTMLREAYRRGQPSRQGIYGLQWGDPETNKKLGSIRDHWLLPYVTAEHVGLEIGPGGGRWTRYMLGFQRLYAVDHYPELLLELRKNFPQPNIVEICNNGTDFPGVTPASVDFVFSFGAFVHMDMDVISGYLAHLPAVIRPQAQLVIQYSDKNKPAAQQNPGFSDNDPLRMRGAVEAAGFRVEEEDTSTLNNSSIMRFSLA